MIVLRFMTRRPEDPERLRVRTRGDVASVSARDARTEGREEGPASVVAEAMDVGREDDARREGGARGDARDGDRARLRCERSRRTNGGERSLVVERGRGRGGLEHGGVASETRGPEHSRVYVGIERSRESRDGRRVDERAFGDVERNSHGVLPTKHTSKMTTKEVKLGARSFDSLNEYILIKDLGRGSHSKVN